MDENGHRKEERIVEGTNGNVSHTLQIPHHKKPATGAP
jgi:hypothetical protein